MRGLRPPAATTRADVDDVHAGGRTVQERHPVDHEGRGEGPHDEVLETGLEADGGAAEKGVEDVERDRQQFEPEKDGQQVD